MSEFERKKIISIKNRNFSKDGSSGKSFPNKSNLSISKGKEATCSDVKQPTILLKNKDSISEDTSTSSKAKPKDHEVASVSALKDSEGTTPVLKHMKKALKLIDDGVVNTEFIQDYLQENIDFIVVGVVGAQGVGKSTILNLLSENKITESFKRSLFKSYSDSSMDFETIKIFTQKHDESQVEHSNIFKIESQEDMENCMNATQGIDIYVTSNRVIFLDCQPFLSVAVLDELIESENKRTNLINDFVSLENSGEIQGLQYTAFLMSVCHILLVVQDWFFDSNIVRFIQTAEMLKPTISNPEDEYCDHFPHLIMIQNRAQMADFTPKQYKVMQKVYDNLFKKSKLQFHTNLGLGSGRVINTLNPENCGNPVNLFLIPDVSDESENYIYRGHPPLEELVKKLKANLFGAIENPLTHVQLTEKTWLLYCNRVWETVKKSPFFVEYAKLMP
ncbi:hypothetical protein ABEB36_006025 [Hypothenemus hampei]|uniref:Protein SMG9 n=2 Tax=Hypothenemus hampei TaxID=57062 RepID=A0ABD1F0N2_HYPHA